MKKHFTIALIFFSTLTLAQDPIPRGSIGIGGFYTCPQSELKTVEYDPGPGFNLNYLSVQFPYQSKVNFQVGVRLDFASMKHKDFEVEINTPVPDQGDYTVRNSMAAIMLNGRINYGYNTKLTPFIDVLAGNRGFSTNADLYAKNPELNPDYEESAFYNRVVHTSRFHYGGGIGVTYDLGRSVQLESSVIYTFGTPGAVQPLKDVVQNGNEIEYNYKENVRTDVLLINLGLRFKLFKQYKNTSRTPTSNPTPTSTDDDVTKRYKDPEPTDPGTSTKPTKTSDPIIKGRDSGGDTDTGSKKKSGIGVKGNKGNTGGRDID